MNLHVPLRKEWNTGGVFLSGLRRTASALAAAVRDVILVVYIIAAAGANGALGGLPGIPSKEPWPGIPQRFRHGNGPCLWALAGSVSATDFEVGPRS